LPDDVALTLVQGTLGGSVGLADAENWADLKALRRNVTSKGGVTEAALDVLMTELPHLINRALDANIARAKELS
jgi:pyrroline-5-carboxylate reductase